MSLPPEPTDPGLAPPSGAHPIPQLSQDQIATLPTSVKSALALGGLLIPLVSAGGAYLSAGQAAAVERAVMATRIQALEVRLESIDGKIDDLIRRRGD